LGAEHGIEGEALIALKHDELKEMGIASVGHRLTILKNVYDIKVNQDIPIEPDDYVPPSKFFHSPEQSCLADMGCLAAEQNPQHEMATKDDINRLARSILRLRDERIAQAEAQLTKLADDYRKLRQELLPVVKMAKDRSEPLPYAPYSGNAISPDLYQSDVVSPPITTQPIPEKTSLTRTFSKKLGLTSSTPKNNSPTHIPSTIHEGRAHTENGGLDPSAAASLASNSLTAQMSGGSLPHPSPGVPSPTSPLPYHQPLAPRSYQREGTINSIARYDGGDDRQVTIERDRDPPTSAKSVSAKLNPTNSTISNASTLIPSREMSASVPPQLPSSAAAGHSSHSRENKGELASSSAGGDAPSVEIFKSFRVGLEDPCYKVLPAALRKYNIQADWRQYALYIVYGDQERCVGLDEKPLALFKELDREGKKPMFMLRKLANPMVGDGSGGPPTATVGIKPPIVTIGQPGGLGMGVGGLNPAGVRTLPGQSLPGGVL
jgi:protein STE50